MKIILLYNNHLFKFYNIEIILSNKVNYQKGCLFKYKKIFSIKKTVLKYFILQLNPTHNMNVYND